MLTTLQARSVLRKNAYSNPKMYTNKINNPNLRNVKVYLDDIRDLYDLLKDVAKLDASTIIKITKGSKYFRAGGPAAIITCTYSEKD